MGWGRAVFGSACLWAWGFLAYLSPVLIPAERPVGGVGIEVGFFVSQGAVVVAAVAIVLALRKRSVAVGRGVLLVCASLLALASALLPLTVAIDAPWPLVGCGAICGVAGTLLGCAWGARYSLESRDVSAVVMGLVPRGLWDLFRNSLALRRNALCRGGPGRCCLSAPSFLGPLVLGCLGTFGACSRGVPLLCSLYRHSGFAGFLGEGSR